MCYNLSLKPAVKRTLANRNCWRRMAAFRDVANMKVLTFRGNNCLPLPVESYNVAGVKKNNVQKIN